MIEEYEDYPQDDPDQPLWASWMNRLYEETYRQEWLDRED